VVEKNAAGCKINPLDNIKFQKKTIPPSEIICHFPAISPRAFPTPKAAKFAEFYGYQ
jgi:hypothetical protein